MNVKSEIKKAEDAIGTAIADAVEKLYDATELRPYSIEVQMLDVTTQDKDDVLVGRVRIKVGI